MKRFFSILSGALFLSSTLTAWAAGDRTPSSTNPAIISWQPPATYSMAPTGGRTSYAEIGGGPVPFFPITPCRQYDSRNSTKLAENTPRTVTLSGAPCGIPATTNAIAVNITVFNITGAGSNGVFKVDTVSPPLIAWINYPPSETQRANAGVVAVSSGALVVQVNQGAGSVDFVVDVFGYYYNGNAAKMPTGDFFSIWGDFSGGAVLFGRNDQATAANSYGARGWAYSTGAGSAGVEGESLAATGVVYGVKGLTSSTGNGAAGVLGVDSSGYNPATGLTYGVLGGSQTGLGVFGNSRYIAVLGYLHNSLDTVIAYGALGSSFGTAADSTTGPWGVFSVGNFGATGTKHFVEPHPTDPKKVILYSSLEGREVGTYFRGTASIVNHEAVIVIPEDFRIVTAEEGLTIQVTPIGGYSQVYIESQDLAQIVVKGSRDVQFHYLVQGVRRAFKDLQPVQTSYIFMPESPSDRMPAYLTEEAKARLISNGTYNPDGTVNMTTAERAGFTKIWADRAAEVKAIAEKNANAAKNAK